MRCCCRNMKRWEGGGLECFQNSEQPTCNLPCCLHATMKEIHSERGCACAKKTSFEQHCPSRLLIRSPPKLLPFRYICETALPIATSISPLGPFSEHCCKRRKFPGCANGIRCKFIFAFLTRLGPSCWSSSPGLSVDVKMICSHCSGWWVALNSKWRNQSFAYFIYQHEGEGPTFWSDSDSDSH